MNETKAIELLVNIKVLVQCANPIWIFSVPLFDFSNWIVSDNYKIYLTSANQSKFPQIQKILVIII